MECIKTGCDAFIPEIGAVVHGDLFKHDGVYILNATGCLHAANYDSIEGHIALYRAARVGNSEVFVCNKMNSSRLYEFPTDLSNE